MYKTYRGGTTSYPPPPKKKFYQSKYICTNQSTTKYASENFGGTHEFMENIVLQRPELNSQNTDKNKLASFSDTLP